MDQMINDVPLSTMPLFGRGFLLYLYPNACMSCMVDRYVRCFIQSVRSGQMVGGFTSILTGVNVVHFVSQRSYMDGGAVIW